MVCNNDEAVGVVGGLKLVNGVSKIVAPMFGPFHFAIAKSLMNIYAVTWCVGLFLSCTNFFNVCVKFICNGNKLYCLLVWFQC